MNDWFQDLHTERKEMVRSLRRNDMIEGIRSLTIDKYADPIHFVYELLQNAEDQNASSVSFSLSDESLEFIHNGEPFKAQDVMSITKLGSDKAKEADKIGCFGIGFKSVFEITERPEIYTTLDGNRFAFAIEDQFIPLALPVDASLTIGITRFVFPFKQPNSDYYTKIRAKLSTLGAETLLFLDHLKDISWETTEETGTYICERSAPPHEWCELISEVGRKEGPQETKHRKYLRFSRNALVASKRKNLTVRVAFRVEKNCIQPEEGLSDLNVYFPTGEKTGLKFRLHAPMLLTDSRANIKRDNETNQLLMHHCAHLVAECLTLVKQMDLLDVEFLQCLPIRPQDFPTNSMFQPIYEAVRDTLRTQPLLPTAIGSQVGHVKPSDARIPDGATMRGLIDQVQLTQLHTLQPNERSIHNSVWWLSEKIRQNTTRDLWVYLKEELGVEEIDLEKFSGMLNLSFIERQSDTWMIQFYRTLFISAQALWKSGSPNPRLRKKEIIRLENNSHIMPFFPGEKRTAYLPTTSDYGLPTVKHVLAQDATVIGFLKELGLDKPDLVDVVRENVLSRYIADPPSNQMSYLRDLDTIADAIQTCDPNSRSELEQALKRVPFIRSFSPAKGAHFWCRPKDVYQSIPELLHWFEGDASAQFVDEKVSKQVAWKVIEEFINHRSKTIRDDVKMDFSPVEKGNTILSDKNPYKRGLQRFDPNAHIDGLDYAMAKPTVQKAQMLWRLLLLHHYILKGDVQTSQYKDYRDPTQDRIKSSIYDICSNTRWLPNRDGKFRKPSEISLFELPEGWENLSENAKNLSSALDMKRVDALEKERESREFQEFKQLRAEFLAWKRRRPLLPESEVTSQERAEKLADRQQESPDVKYQKRLRSVRTSSRDLREADRRYLMEYCENPDGKMICQICCKEMPFKVNDEYYFEATHVLKKTLKEVIRNKIALCPVCAAKWQYANAHTSDEILQKLTDCSGTTIDVTLAGQAETVHFFKTHLGDLKAVLRSITDEKRV